MTVETFMANFGHLADAPNGVKKLREMILQLAVQGKLFGVQSKPVRSDTKVKDFVSLQNGYAFKSSWFARDGVRLVRNKNISHGYLDWADTARIPANHAGEYKRFGLSTGDIVLSLDRPIISSGLKVARITETDLPSLLLQRVGRFLFKSKELLPDYLYLWLQSPSFIEAIDPGRSNGVPHIASKEVENLPLEVFRLQEQKRIVAKVDQLMTLCDELEARQQNQQQGRVRLNNSALDALLTAREPNEFADHWQRISTNFDLLYDHPETIAKLRAAILQHAVQGKLVTQDPNDEPASDLLARIKAEKERLVRDGKIKKKKQLPAIDEVEKPFELPVGIPWVRLQDLVLLLGDGLHGTPIYTPGTQYYFVNGNNLNNGLIEIKPHTKTVSYEELQKHKKELSSNSVLVSNQRNPWESGFLQQ